MTQLAWLSYTYMYTVETLKAGARDNNGCRDGAGAECNKRQTGISETSYCRPFV